MLGWQSTFRGIRQLSQTPELLHSSETELWVDASCGGVDKREDIQATLIEKRIDTETHAARSQASPLNHEVGLGLAENDGEDLREIEDACTLEGWVPV